MKKHTLIALSLFSALNGMEQHIAPNREPREWDAQAYADGNKLQVSSFLHFLATNNIKTNKRNILEVACGTAEIAAKLAQNGAHHVHGFDASENMIKHAYNKFKDIEKIENISFEHCFAEDFKTSPRLYQLALMSSCFHWFEDKRKALQRVNDCLDVNGELFANIDTSSNPIPLNLVVYEEMKQDIPLLGTYISNCTNPIGSTRPTADALKTMLDETNFNILNFEEQSFNCRMTVGEFKKFQWPIVASRPGMQYLPDFLIQPLFEKFIERCLAKLQKNNDETYTYTFTTTVIHAAKK